MQWPHSSNPHSQSRSKGNQPIEGRKLHTSVCHAPTCKPSVDTAALEWQGGIDNRTCGSPEVVLKFPEEFMPILGNFRIIYLYDSIILWPALLQVHSLFQTKFSTQCDLVLPRKVTVIEGRQKTANRWSLIQKAFSSVIPWQTTEDPTQLSYHKKIQKPKTTSIHFSSKLSHNCFLQNTF